MPLPASLPPQARAAAPQPGPTPASADDATPSWGCGWYLSSLELRRGVEVREEGAQTGLGPWPGLPPGLC